MYNLYNAEAQFKEFLIAGNISNVSIRNYLSDYRHFCGWAKGNTPRDATDQVKIEANLFSGYQTYLLASRLPPSTMKRRLSTLRKLLEFFRTTGMIDDTVYVHSPVPIQMKKPLALDQEKYNNILSEFKYDLLMETTPQQAELLLKNIDEVFRYATNK
jgi:site-specific recombinase XerD